MTKLKLASKRSALESVNCDEDEKKCYVLPSKVLLVISYAIIQTNLYSVY